MARNRNEKIRALCEDIFMLIALVIGFGVICGLVLLIVFGSISIANPTFCPGDTVYLENAGKCISLSTPVHYEDLIYSQERYDKGVIMLSVGSCVLGIIIIAGIISACSEALRD
jgi:hypothetical protein